MAHHSPLPIPVSPPLLARVFCQNQDLADVRFGFAKIIQRKGAKAQRRDDVLLNLDVHAVCYNAVESKLSEGADMAESQRFGVESDAVRAHVGIMQGVVSRMSDYSRFCKVGAVTLVSAVLFLSARADEANIALVALAPAGLFWVLDAYYLSLERAFRASYDSFVAKVHAGSVGVGDLYVVRPSGSVIRGVFWGLFKSFSVSPFYLMVAGTVGLAWMAISG